MTLHLGQLCNTPRHAQPMQPLVQQLHGMLATSAPTLGSTYPCQYSTLPSLPALMHAPSSSPPR